MVVDFQGMLLYILRWFAQDAFFTTLVLVVVVVVVVEVECNK